MMRCVRKGLVFVPRSHLPRTVPHCSFFIAHRLSHSDRPDQKFNVADGHSKKHIDNESTLTRYDADSSLEGLRAENTRLLEENMDLRRQLSMLMHVSTQTRESLEHEVKKLERENMQLRFENGKLKEQLVAHELRLTAQDSKIANLEGTVASQQKELMQLRDEVDRSRGDAATIAVAQLVSCVQFKAARYLTYCAMPEKAMFMKLAQVERKMTADSTSGAKLLEFEQQLRAVGLLRETQSVFEDLQMVLDSFVTPRLPLAHPELSDKEISDLVESRDEQSRALLEVCQWLETKVRDGGIMKIPHP